MGTKDRQLFYYLIGSRATRRFIWIPLADESREIIRALSLAGPRFVARRTGMAYHTQESVSSRCGGSCSRTRPRVQVSAAAARRGALMAEFLLADARGSAARCWRTMWAASRTDDRADHWLPRSYSPAYAMNNPDRGYDVSRMVSGL
jgi:hypothetical protein